MTGAQRRTSSWLPSELIERIVREPLETFLRTFDTTPVLIVRLDDFSDDLRSGLVDTDAKRRTSARAIKSTLHLSPGVTQQLHNVRSELSTSADMSDARQRVGFPLPELLSRSCYVLRLTGRTERPGPLTIGRDPSHHIILQHPSVSATHAYLSVGAELTLRDAPSRNGSFVNEAQIGSELVSVKVGDRIKLGAVQSVLCSATQLWHALN